MSLLLFVPKQTTAEATPVIGVHEYPSSGTYPGAAAYPGVYSQSQTPAPTSETMDAWTAWQQMKARSRERPSVLWGSPGSALWDAS